MTESPVTVRPKRAAELLDISYAELKKLISSGELRSFKLGAARLIPVEGIHEWVDGRMASQAPR